MACMRPGNSHSARWHDCHAAVVARGWGGPAPAPACSRSTARRNGGRQCHHRRGDIIIDAAGLVFKASGPPAGMTGDFGVLMNGPMRCRRKCAPMPTRPLTPPRAKVRRRRYRAVPHRAHVRYRRIIAVRRMIRRMRKGAKRRWPVAADAARRFVLLRRWRDCR